MNLNDYEIETPHGWCKFLGVKKISNRELFSIILENNKTLKVTSNHILFSNGKEILVSQLKNGDILDIKNGNCKIISITKDSGLYDVFDVVGIQNEDSTYYTNDIISHNCNFSGSSYTLIDGDILSKLTGTTPLSIVNDGYFIWKSPTMNRIYVFGCDVAKGANSDYSVVNIYDVTDFKTTGVYEQVAIFRRNDVSIFEFKDKILELAKEWNNAFVIIENNNLGSVIVKDIFEAEYEYLYFDADKQEYGINANVKTKPLALSFFKEDVEQNKLKINYGDMLKELNYFEEVKPGVFGARPGRNFHDDTVASSYWVSYALRSRSFEDYMYDASKRVTSLSTGDSAADEDILNSFNNVMRKMSDRDQFRNDLMYN